MLILGDCLEEMAKLPAASVDLILADLPYGTTQCAFDSLIPFDGLWLNWWRVLRPGCAIVLTAAQPFTSALTMSQVKNFKYGLVWNKVLPRGHLNAKKQPMRLHEDVLIFGKGPVRYFPQKTQGHKRKIAHTRYEKGGDGSQVYGKEVRDTHYDSTERYPTSIMTFSNADQNGKIHPTQKPVALMEYLIRTYSNEGDVVMDNCFGSCTTGVACLNTGRTFIGIERDPEYFRLGSDRFHNHVPSKELFA